MCRDVLLYYLKLYNIVGEREVYNYNVRRHEQMRRTQYMQRASVSTTTLTYNDIIISNNA